METVAIVPMMGLSPVSHMGHYLDIGSHLLNGDYDQIVVGISLNNVGVFTPKEREEVIDRQWTRRTHVPNLKFLNVKSAGETVAYAYDTLTSFRPKRLTIVVGGDRIKFGEGLKRSIENDKIPELMGGKFTSVDVVTTSISRLHGFSGTTMREAALLGDIGCFNAHLGDMFDRNEMSEIYDRTRSAIVEGRLKLHRK